MDVCLLEVDFFSSSKRKLVFFPDSMTQDLSPSARRGPAWPEITFIPSRLVSAASEAKAINKNKIEYLFMQPLFKDLGLILI
jgi:hypothetical protein